MNWALALCLDDVVEARGDRLVLGGYVFGHPLHLLKVTVGGLGPRNVLVATSWWVVVRITFGACVLQQV